MIIKKREKKQMKSINRHKKKVKQKTYNLAKNKTRYTCMREEMKK